MKKRAQILREPAVGAGGGVKAPLPNQVKRKDDEQVKEPS